MLPEPMDGWGLLNELRARGQKVPVIFYTAYPVFPSGTDDPDVVGYMSKAIDRADLNRIDNWRARRLEFDRVPLSQVLTEFSRYTLLPIRAATPAVGDRRGVAVRSGPGLACVGSS